jgi:predicted glycoside hydrolase/deacetylase ChbG (UPF0249 family)
MNRSWDQITHPLRAWQFVLLTALIGAGTAQTASAETWAERLGYPPGKKVLILHAHDMGLCRATNAAAEALDASKLTHSTSALPTAPWFADYAKTASDEQNADVGLALVLNSEWPNYRWQPLTSDNLVSSLVDRDGYLWPTAVQTMVNADAAEVEQELQVQVLRAQLAGLQPTHFTTHLGTLFTRLDLAEVYLRLAREHWIPAVVVELTPAHVERFQKMGYPIPEELVQLISDYPLPKVDDLVFMPGGESYAAKKQAFIDMIKGLPPGLVQVSLQPAVESDELKHIDPDWQQRVWELQLLEDEEVLALLQSDDVILTNWREIMQRFTGAGPAVEKAK